MSDRRVETVAAGYSFLEGPRWHDERLFVSDFYTHRVLAFDESSRADVVCTVPGQPSGLGFALDGALLVVSMVDRKLLRFDRGRLSTVADLSALATFHCNDMLVDATGTAYIGNFGWNAEPESEMIGANLVAVSPDGAVRVAASDLIFPNGVVKTKDNVMLVAETFAGRITAFDVTRDGRLENRRDWANLATRPYRHIRDALASCDPLPDGLALDEEGCVWMGDAGGRGALRVSEGGRVLDRIETPNLTVYAVALGGRDRKTAYLCAAPALTSHDPSVDREAVLFSCRVDVPGIIST